MHGPCKIPGPSSSFEISWEVEKQCGLQIYQKFLKITTFRLCAWLQEVMVCWRQFSHNTLEQYFKNLKSEDGMHTTYCFSNFEVRAFCTSERSLNTKNVISRMRNALITALNEHSVLPKLIIVVPDDDILTQSRDDPNPNLMLSSHYERLMTGMCKLFVTAMIAIRICSPPKAKCENIPHILW